MSAQVALVHGILEKVCPHNSTGRADYFGSTVNRAARLLCAAKPGQILAEAPVMEAVLKEGMGADSASMLLKTKSSALSQSGEVSSFAVNTGNTSDTPPSPKPMAQTGSSSDRSMTADAEQVSNGTVTTKALQLEAVGSGSGLLQPASLSPGVAA
ncbi:hypothetical protein ABBQ38_006525 [Trebouxia sp. C0009 RCD-2024]